MARHVYPKVTIAKGVRVVARKPPGDGCYMATIWKDGEYVETVVGSGEKDWWYDPNEARYYGRLRAVELFGDGSKSAEAPSNAPAAPRSVPQVLRDSGQPAELIEVIRALRRLEEKWPRDFWLFAASGSLCLMKKKGGKRAVLPCPTVAWTTVASWQPSAGSRWTAVTGRQPR